MKSAMKIVFVLFIIMSILLTPTVARGGSAGRGSGGSRTKARGGSGHGTKARGGSSGSGTKSSSGSAGRGTAATTTWIPSAHARPTTTSHNNNSSSSTSFGWYSMAMALFSYLTIVYF
ncbi:hypothetical protein HAX54_035673 [Datura stramonium]|uniref:Uncharacterized protein n=1 Tax=Datura stramonium TaxID=4076 RepID=A0ABS8VFU6_DATST|nr:hypothetical protein [Datura stramonium]